MNKAALTSINKPHTDKIFAIDETERKIVEWRTKPLPKGKHYVYETKNKGGCGQVIGEMTVLGWRKFESIEEIPADLIRKGKVGRDFIKAYAKGRAIYANELYGAKRYDKPKELREFNGFKKCNQCKVSGYDSGACMYDEDCMIPVPLERAPQSWQFVYEELE